MAAAGNIGKDADGRIIYGGITAPGNAPWVLTVGASDTKGTSTPERRRDRAVQLARARRAIDYAAKPDLVAPGTGIVSLASAGSTLYQSHPAYLVAGTRSTAYKPYLTLSGTSMAAPVVSGHRRADAAGESGADAEPGEGDPAVHGAGLPTTTR